MTSRRDVIMRGTLRLMVPIERAFLREELMDNRDGVKKDIFIYPLILGHVPLISWY